MKKGLLVWFVGICVLFGLTFTMDCMISSSVAHAAESEYSIDRDSAWWDRDKEMFGAGVTDTRTGKYFTVAYQLVNITDRVIDVMESKNRGEWVQIGVIDWNRMCSADIGRPETGGMLFARVANVCAQSKGYQKMF